MNKSGLLVVLLITVLAAVGAALWLLGDDPSPSDDATLAAGRSPDDASQLDMQLTVEPHERGMSLGEPRREADARPMLDESDLPARVAGEVVDRSGHAIAGAAVTLLLVQEEGLARRYVTAGPPVEVDAEGRFDFVGVPADTVLVAEARASSFAPITSAPFRVAPAALRDLGRLVLEPGTRLVGRVTDVAKSPIEGAFVRVVEMGRADGTSGEPLPLAEATTDAEGRYEIDGLASRQYGLEVGADGFSPMNLVLSFVLGRSDTWVQDVELEPSDTRLDGIVLSSLDEPVAGLELHVLRRRSTGASYFTASTVSADDGTFSFPAVAAGRYDVEVRASEWYLPAPRKLEAGPTLHELRVHPALTVVGRTLTETGVPLPRDFEVTAKADGRTGAALLDPSRRTRKIEGSDPPGTFRFEGLRPGTYSFLVVAPGFAVTTSPDVSLGPDVPEVELVIPLLAGGTLTGRVQPLPVSGRIELRESTWDPSLPLEHAFPTAPLPGMLAKLAADGTFRIAHVPEGSYVLTLRADGAPAVHLRDVSVLEGGKTDVGMLTVLRGGSVAGSVTGSDGRLAGGAQISLSGEGFHQRCNADPDGGFRFDAIPPGRYQVVAAPAGLFEALKYEGKLDIDVRADETSEARLLLVERNR